MESGDQENNWPSVSFLSVLELNGDTHMASSFPSPSHAQAPVAEVRRGCCGSALVMDKWSVEGTLNSVGALVIPSPRMLTAKANPHRKRASASHNLILRQD